MTNSASFFPFYGTVSIWAECPNEPEGDCSGDRGVVDVINVVDLKLNELNILRVGALAAERRSRHFARCARCMVPKCSYSCVLMASAAARHIAVSEVVTIQHRARCFERGTV